jgi:hypothetical protein
MLAASLGRRNVSALAGLASGCALALLLVVVVGTAVAQRSGGSARAVFDATHLPPLLTLPGERVDLSYEVQCAPEGVEDPESACDVSGVLHLRTAPRGEFRSIPLRQTSAAGLRGLTATLPADVAAAPRFEYYAELEAAGTGDRIVIPAGGADAPHRSLRLSSPIDVNLGLHAFGSTDPGTRIVSAPWGDGPASVGLEPGRDLAPIGGSAFDVEKDGTISLLDQAHRRALRWRLRGSEPTRIPLAIRGRMADMTVDDDDSIYVLESVAPAGRTPLIRHFDRTGRELDVVESAEQGASQVRIGPRGPVVLQHPSHEWMPVSEFGAPTAPREQRRRGRVGRPLPSGDEVVVLRREHDILAAVVSRHGTERSWRITSETPLAEVQLAEPVGSRLVLVARAYSDTASEFVVLVLGPHGTERTFSTPADEWAEATPNGRFRIAGNRLYRLGSDSTSAFVVRYDLGGA